MALDLFVWHEAEPISADHARAKLDQWAEGDNEIFGSCGEVVRFRETLLHRFPDLEVSPEPADRIVTASCGWLRAAEVSEAVIELAAKHGLVCYEPGSHVLNPNAPGYVAEFVLTGDGVPTFPDPDAQRLDWAVRRLSDRNYFAVLERADGRYAQVGYGSQAAVPDGTWALEHSEGGRHFQARTRDVAEAVWFLQSYLAGADAWRTSLAWQPLNLG